MRCSACQASKGENDTCHVISLETNLLGLDYLRAGESPKARLFSLSHLLAKNTEREKAILHVIDGNAIRQQYPLHKDSEAGITQCSPLPRDSADRGGAAGGGVRQESTLQLHKLFCFQTCGKAALRLTVNPFGSQARHFPYLPRKQGKTLLRFRLLIMIHSYIDHRAIAYIALTRRHRGRHSPAAVCG